MTIDGSEQAGVASESNAVPAEKEAFGLRAALCAAAVMVIAVSVYRTFNIGIWTGYVPVENQYYYVILALLLPFCFLLRPIPLGGQLFRALDFMLAGFAFVIAVYFALNGEHIVMQGWEYAAPTPAVWASLAIWVLTLEAARRVGGWILFSIVVLLSVYPLFAGALPDILAGRTTPLTNTAIYYSMSKEALLGIPMRAFINLVIGFLVFGVALQKTGGGRFFLDLAFSLLGRSRGGPAKVAIFSSGLMGSLSGSVITNVLTTGSLTIPAMRRIGVPKETAAGIEACASTGGVLMPPIMGATAFVMATFLNVPYNEVAIAAALPSVLYFFGLFIQVDSYAARNSLQGMPADELPALRRVLVEGWYFIAVFALLIWMLLILKQEAWAPWFATALLLCINQFSSRFRWGPLELQDFFESTGRLFAELAGLLAGIGLIVGALVVTGKIGTIANDLLAAAGGSTFLLLLMGAATAFVLGIGMTVTAAYIFLAVGLAPALINAGLDPLAVHLFILYWSMLSYITPPVALGAFAAATLSSADPLRTGVQAMRLGGIIYFIPFFFVTEPALILQGAPVRVAWVFLSALVGVWLISCALQRYVIGVGRFPDGVFGLVLRGLILLSGLAFAMPGGALTSLSSQSLLAIALLLLVPPVLAIRLSNRNLMTNQGTSP